MTPTDAGLNERVDIAVEHGLGLRSLIAGAQILDHLVRVEHVAANLVAKTNRGLGSANLIERLGALLELNLVQTSLEDLDRKSVV